MTYELEFSVKAEKEWKKLDPDTRNQYLKKLKERLENPKIPASRLHHMPDCYKIKLRTRGYRLVYRVRDEIVTVIVIAIRKREGGEVYDSAEDRQ